MSGTAAADDAGTGGVVALPDDAVFEVFSRVRNVKALFRCAATCRRWLCLITDRDFLRRLWPQQDLLLGFFLNSPKKRRGRTHNHASSSPLTFVPTPTSPISSVDGARRVSFPDNDGRMCYSVELLASRRGVLLVRFVPCKFVEEERKTRFLFGLHDPIAGAHDFLPELECARHGTYENGYAILTAADFDDIGQEQQLTTPTRHSLSSQVIFIDRHHDDHHWHIHTYSAATRSWSAPTTCTHADQVWLTGERGAVVHRGVAHWLCIGAARVGYPWSRDNRDLYVLGVDAGNGRVSLTKLPIRSSGFPFFFVSRDDERLSIACVEESSVDVWTQQGEDDPAAWLCARVIQIPVPMTWAQRNKGTMLATYGGDGEGHGPVPVPSPRR